MTTIKNIPSPSHTTETSETIRKALDWTEAACSGAFSEVKYHKSSGIAKITINRPKSRNAFTPRTVEEMRAALLDAKNDTDIGVVVLAGEGERAFCAGGDQRVRGHSGYKSETGGEVLNVLDFQREIRNCHKPVIAMVAGWAIGGGHVLHMMCDLTIAAENARFGQVGPRMGSFDGGFGASYMARIIGQKRAREMWMLCRSYSAQEALSMGLVNVVVPVRELEEATVKWCKEILANSPTALRAIKAALNADCDGQAGLQELSGLATMLYYMTDEAKEGRNAQLEKRPANFRKHAP